MAMTVWGIVKEGRVVPDSPLPEGARVEIILSDDASSVPADLQLELEGWDRASAAALDLVERLANQGKPSDDAR